MNRLRLAITALVTAGYVLACTSPPAQAPAIPPTPAEEPAAPTSVAPASDYEPGEMQTDLAYVIDRLLEVHPELVNAFPAAMAEALDRTAARLTTAMSAAEYHAVLSNMLSALQDPHTQLLLPQDIGRFQLPVVWLADGLFLYRDVASDRPAKFADSAPPARLRGAIAESGLRAGDEVVAVESVPVPVIGRILADSVLGGASRRTVRSVGEAIVFSDLVLSQLGVDLRKTHLVIQVLREGGLIDVPVRRLTDDGQLVETTIEAPQYRLSGSAETGEYRSDIERFPRAAGVLPAPQVRIIPDSEVAYFRFDFCRPGQEYRDALRELFTATTMERLSAVVVDLRYNIGGNSEIVAEFLRYLGAREYSSFTQITRFSPVAADQYGHSRTEGAEIVRSQTVQLSRLQYPSLVFSGQVYLLISRHTASAALRFATILQDQGLAVLVGESSATPVGTFDNPVQLRTPELGIEIAISHSRFIGPGGDDGTLAHGFGPDILVETEIGDVQSEFDRQLAYVVRRAARGR